MDNEQTFEQYVVGQLKVAGEIMEQHDFMIRAMSGEIERLRKLVPDTETEPENAVKGDTRGETTAYKLPHGLGTLMVTIDPEKGTAKLRAIKQGHGTPLTLIV